VLDQPEAVSVRSVREIADAADIKPNTLVRLARAVGFTGFDDMRAPFRDQVLSGRDSFPDKARWLQELGRGGRLDALYANMAAAAFDNIESLYSANEPAALKAAADRIIAARRTYVLGVGVANPMARNFTYVAGMALDGITAIPNAGSLPTDDLARADDQDLLIAMTFKPWRREVVDAVMQAHAQDVPVIAISDSLAAPIMIDAAVRFLVPTETPQVFNSTVALAAFLETLLAFVVAEADPEVLKNIEQFHERRHDLGIYWPTEGGPG
jgi:DNA-binding MurR/RpiR family transcriptional regulator